MYRTIPLVCAVLAIAGPALAKDDPLAPARSGHLQCYAPKPERKACQAIAGYTFSAGGVQNQAEVMLSPNPLVVLKTVTPVTVKSGAVCGPFRKEDIDAGTILLNGQPLDAARAAGVKAKLEAALADRLGKEICTTYTPNGASLMATATIDGAPDPTGGQSVIWIGPGDGYKVAP